MRTELRFLMAIGLMVLVLVGTNVMFPPVQEDPVLPPDSSLGEPASPIAETEADTGRVPSVPVLPQTPGAGATVDAEPGPATDGVPAAAVPEQIVTAEGPLFRFIFSSHGARMLSAELVTFESFTREGAVQLIPDDETSTFGVRLLVSGDTVDLRRAPFVPSTTNLTVTEGGGPSTLRFTYDHPTEDFGVELAYTFKPDSYDVEVRGSIRGIDAGVLFTELGSGIAFNEVNTEEEARLAAYVTNHTDEGIRAVSFDDVEGLRVDEGPFLWTIFKSKFFMFGAMAGTEPETEEHFGGLIARERLEGARADITFTQPFGPNGQFGFRIYAGPQDFQILSSYENDLEKANPYGWRFMRPLIQPFTGFIIRVLKWIHERFSLEYGWVLIIFGVMMRVVFFPLYHRSMKAQLKNMAVQPLLKEIQTKYKDTPEKMQKELMKLYKEHGFNPLAGCLPMLLPWPVLVALFFVFQNTIELRGVPFLWLPDLSLADPYYILPIIMGFSMFLLQWVGFRSMDQVNPQMKMMMWFMPIFLVFIFFRLPSGLNLYYATANIATLPQQFWIANERKKARGSDPKLSPETKPKAEVAAAPSGKGRSKHKSARKR